MTFIPNELKPLSLEKPMNRLLATAAILIAAAAPLHPQSIEDLNLQIHGYATQGFLYTDHNNWNTTSSSDGSAAWTEAVVNIALQPEPKLRIGVQARYYLLGNYGNAITLDFASLDYKANDWIGFRAGKVKSPVGMLNETQDIDPTHLWVLLPQSIYPIGSRNSQLAHYGGVLYGTAPLGRSLGKMDYRAFGGQRVVGSEDSSLQQFADIGYTLPSGVSGRTFGGTLHWQTPLRGLGVGATYTSEQLAGAILAGPLAGSTTLSHIRQPFFFGKYERDKFMFGGEYSRQALLSDIQVAAYPGHFQPYDTRAMYLMTSWKFSDKLTAGAYYSNLVNRTLPPGGARDQKDWAFTGRCDFNPFLYLKLEQHVMNGTVIGFAAAGNPQLNPSTRMSLLKLGTSF
jgi:hypothetical protein